MCSLLNTQGVDPGHYICHIFLLSLCNKKKQQLENQWVRRFEETKGVKKKFKSVNRRRTDNTMTKRKSTKGQTTIYKTYT